MMLHFIRPEWLWALLPLIGLLVALYKTQGSNTAWSRYIAPHLAHLLIDTGKKSTNTSIIYIAIIWLLTVFSLSGPALTKESLPVFASTQGRVIVMDMSQSMYATDLIPNRLSQARYKATDLIKSLKEGETGLIAYAGDAFTISPLTRDKGTLLNLLPNLTPNIMPVSGSNVASALIKAKELLSQGGHIKGDIILFADGIKESQLSDAKKALSGTEYRLAIMAMGTAQGAAIRLPTGELLRDNSNQVVVAKTNFSALSKLASSFQGIVTQNQADDSDTQDIENWLATENSAKVTDLQGEAWQDLGPYVALLILPLLLFSFRKQFSVVIVVVALNLSQTPNAQALDWESLWQTQNQLGQKSYDKKDYQQAVKQFDDLQWKASADYKAGNYEQALKGFEQNDSAQSLYNQGNSLMHMNQYAKAEQRYQQALEKDPNLANAKQNLELANKLQKQQKQQKKQENNEKDDKKNQNKKQQQDDKKSQKDSDSEKQKNKNSDQKQKPEQSNPDEKKQQNQNNKDDSKDKQQEQEQKNKNEKLHPQKDEVKAEKTDPNKQKDLPPEMQRLLKAIPDDPQLLLRNKMQLEYQKRRQQGRLSKENEQW